MLRKNCQQPLSSEMLFNEKGNTLERFVNEVSGEDRNAVSQFIHDLISWLKARLKGEKVSFEITRLKNRFAAVLRNVDTNAQKNNTTNDGDVQYSLKEIVGVDGTNYGMGVYLDSELLTNLTDTERIEMVKEYIKELGGKSLSAFDNNGEKVTFKISENDKHFVNNKGRKVPVNKDLKTKYNKTRQNKKLLLLLMNWFCYHHSSTKNLRGILMGGLTITERTIGNIGLRTSKIKQTPFGKQH